MCLVLFGIPSRASLPFSIIMNITCLQANLHKSALATGLFTHGLSLEPALGFVTEPHTAFRKVVGKPPEYFVYPESAMEAVPRAALYIPKNLKHVSLKHLCNADCQVVNLFVESGQIVIASIYLDINDDPVPDWMERIVQYATQHSFDLLLTMDSNCHSQLFGPDNNSRGDLFEQFIFQHGLQVMNRGTAPTFQTFSAESHIDVTLTKGTVVLDWEVLESYNASDHNTIHFILPSTVLLPPREIRDWKSGEWDKFESLLANETFTVPEVITTKKLDKMVNHLYSRIEEHLDVCCPIVKTKVKFQGSRWFSERLAKRQRKVRKQYDIAQRVGTVEEQDKYFSIHRKFKRECRKAKTAKWRHFVTETENEHKMSRLAKIALHNDRLQLHSLRQEDGTMTGPGKPTLLELAKTHFPSPSQELPTPKYSSQRSFPGNEALALYPDYITPRLVRAAISRFKPMKAPGPDGLKPIVLKYLPANIILFLTVIFASCLKLQYTPLLWQKAKVVFLPKPGKKHYILGKEFRPIVLSNFFLKTLERLITWRMEYFLERYYPIHTKQHGFTKGKSTESAISNVVDYIEQCLFRRKSCIGVFLDISSAYDSIHIEHIRTSLYKHGGDVDLVEWYFHYLSNRILSLSLHGDTIKLHVNRGFPQGGVASAKFWLIAFNPAIEIINSMFLEGNGYADDCCMLFGGRDIDILLFRLQRALDRLVRWGRSCGLRFNPDKTIVVNFSRKRNSPLIPHLRVDDIYVPYSRTAVYLGVTLDAKLRWRAHLDDRISRSKKYLMKMAGIAKATWGPKPHLSRWVYRCVVRPMIVYASIIWTHSIDSEARCTKLRRINRLAMCTYTLFPHSLPTRGLEILTDTFPLHLWLFKEALCAYVRLAKQLLLTWPGTNKNKRGNIAHRRFWALKVEEFDLSTLLLHVDSCYFQADRPLYIIRTDSFHKDISYVQQIPTTGWQIFTDGSKKDRKVGAAYIIFHDNSQYTSEKFRLPDTSSVYQAELYAIFRAVEFLLTLEDLTETSFTFFSDSMSALQALEAFEMDSLLVQRVYTKLNLLASLGSVELWWVKAHSGHVRNELVDKLAKEGTEMHWISYVELPRSQIRQQVLDKLRDAWKLEWQTYTEARHCKLFLTGPDKSRGKQICALNRVDLRRLFLAITNHNFLRYHMNLQDETINPTCRFCHMYDETFDHFLQCSHFISDKNIAGLHWHPHRPDDWTVDAMIGFIKNTQIARTLDMFELQPLDTDNPPILTDISDSDSETYIEDSDCSISPMNMD